MLILIDIPKIYVEDIKASGAVPPSDAFYVGQAIKNGTIISTPEHDVEMLKDIKDEIYRASWNLSLSAYSEDFDTQVVDLDDALAVVDKYIKEQL